MAAAVFALASTLMQRGGLQAPRLSVRHPSSFLHLAGQGSWLVGAALVFVGWTLQAMALDRGTVTVIEPIFSTTVVFVLPLGWWLTAQTVTLRQALQARCPASPMQAMRGAHSAPQARVLRSLSEC